MADELLLSIEKLIYGGDGLAHTADSTVFVPYVLPGEQVMASVRTRKKKLVHANLVEVKQPSSSRIKPTCPHFGLCGGCHYQHIDFAQQVSLKKGILRESLSRLGGVTWENEIHEHTAEPYAYRNRAQWAFRDALPRAFGYFLPESARILLDARSDGYADRQRRIDFGRSRAWGGASAGLSSLGHSRPSRIARAFGKRCDADQFFICPFRRARLCRAHSCCGGINDHCCLSPCLEAEKRAAEERGCGFRALTTFWSARLQLLPAYSWHSRARSGRMRR